MPSFCCVVNCSSRRPRDKVQFYRLPAVLQFKHKKNLNSLSARRRQKWLEAIKRIDFAENKQKNAVVCSKHFIAGKPAKLEDELDPDWIPSLNMGYSKDGFSGSSKIQRFIRNKKILNEIPENTVLPSTSHGELEMNEDEVKEPQDLPFNDKCVNSEIEMEEMTNLVVSQSRYLEAEMKFNTLVLTYCSLENNDAKTRYYTGLPTYKVFKIVVDDITPFVKIHMNTVLPVPEQILLSFIKLRLNLDFTDLAYRFGISKFLASTYFKTILHILYLRYKELVFWPEKTALSKKMPSCFKEAFHDKTTIIIDCFEIKTQTPSNMLAAAQSWPHYKHSQTVKYLIGITPQGSVCFVSEGWGGRVSDKLLTENCVLVQKLQPGDVIMADRGFLIKEFFELFNITVKLPAFTKGKTQLHPIDLENTRGIASVRIHVERAIGSIRQKYRILHDVLPISLLSTLSEHTILDEIVHVACALYNMCPPIAPL